jgi:aspartate/methionine/tyrosine aminotransferase
VESDEVLIFAGASEAIYTFMRSALNPGDGIVVQWPLFNTLHGIARSIGCRVREWQAADPIAMSYDVSALVDLCDERTRLIVINFPHNPTGQTISQGGLQQVVEIARRCDSMLFSDEQFRLLELPPTETLPAACDLYEKAISISGVSKTLGLGGLRIGWMVTRCREVLAAAQRYRFYTTEMTNTPCQLLASRALDRSAEILVRNRAYIAENLEQLRRFVQQHRDLLVLQSPKAGTMAIVQQNTPLTSVEFCERLISEERTFLVPADLIGLSNRSLRFGLGRQDLAAGLDRLGQFLRQFA